MSQKLRVDGFKLVENTYNMYIYTYYIICIIYICIIHTYNKGFIENYNEDNNEIYFLKVNVKYHERELHNYLPFFP